MEDSNKTDWRSIDYRIESLSHIIDGLSAAIKVLEQRMMLGGWYDAIWFREDSEPIFGLAFIAFQNYVNASIIDRYHTIDGKEKRYALGKKIGISNRTDIELIISLANFTKHKDWGELHKGTKEILLNLGLNPSPESDIVESPIFEGVEMLTPSWELNEILQIVKEWRHTIWSSGHNDYRP